MNNDERFVAHLYALAAAERDANDARARAALAALRRGRGKEPGTVPETFPHVVPWLLRDSAQDGGLWTERCYFLIGALFAGHRWSREHIAPDTFTESHTNLGASFRMFERTSEAEGRAVSESTEKRFAALLECGREDLPDHLRYAVNLLGDTPIDWAQLLGDLRYWETRANVPMRWAREYWYRPPPRPAEDAAQAPTGESEEMSESETE